MMNSAKGLPRTSTKKDRALLLGASTLRTSQNNNNSIERLWKPQGLMAKAIMTKQSLWFKILM